MRKMMLFLMVFTGLGLFAQDDEVDTFVQWDLDRDGYILDEEYDEFWSGSNYYEDMDSDGDGMINKDEWEKDVQRYYRDSEGWSENEYNDFGKWDADGNGTLSEDEFREGSYSTWDHDRDGRIAEEEYNNFYRLD